MLMFEKLLVKELQKQQSRAEFCDIVLQSQGVSVPVHSCVLSAFSPWLCGTLSAMPSPRNGQRRLIEVPAVEACTLLSLVSLLYSGQFPENKQEVLSAAGKLGINIPQREAQRPKDQNTQTESMKDVVERDCQTETLTFECPNSKEAIETVNLTSWSSDQGLRVYADGSEITLGSLQNIQGDPQILPSFQALDAAPESVVYPTVSGPACLPQVYVCPPAASFQTLVPVVQSSCDEPSANQGEPAGVSECVLEAFSRFENNIPGFINYFLDTNTSEDVQLRDKSQRRGVKSERRGKRARGAGANGGFSVKVERLSVCRRQCTNRYGRVARSIGMGQGGSRVGRTLVNRQMFKIWRRKRGRGAIKDEADTGRLSSRGRPRKRGTGSRGRAVEPVCQEPAPAPRRRGRPRKKRLSRNPSEAPEQKTTTAPGPSMIHTTALPAANQSGLTQPMEWLIDDVIAQLPFIPSNPNGITSATTLDSSVDHPRTQSSVKLADIGIVQPQAEGELNDILDSFLRTFENHVGSCDPEFPDVPNVSDGSQTCESAQNYTSNSQPTSTNTTKRASNATRRPRAARRTQKPFGYWQVTGVKTEKSQSEDSQKTGRMTRSQNRKRKLEESEKQREQIPAKRRRNTKRQRKERSKVEVSLAMDVKDKTKKMKHREDSNRDGLKKVMNHVKTSRKSSNRLKSANNPSFVQNKPACHTKRDVTKSGNASQAKHSVATNKASTPQAAVSAFEIMKNILKNQQKREEERKDYGVWTVEKQEDKRVEVKGHGRRRINQKKTRGRKDSFTKNRPTSKTRRLMENGCSKSRFQTTDSPFKKRMKVKNTADGASVSHSPQKTNKKLGNTQGSSESSDEDVDVVEVSSSLSESFAVLPVTDIVLSSEEEEEEGDEDEEIDIISLGSR